MPVGVADSDEELMESPTHPKSGEVLDVILLFSNHLYSLSGTFLFVTIVSWNCS